MQLNQQEDLQHQFVQQWLDFATEHSEEMRLAEWLKTLSIMTGVVLAISDAPRAAVEGIVNDFSEAVKEVYEQSANFADNRHPYQ